MTSAREVWELSRHFLSDQVGSIAVLKVYMDESGVHDDSPVVAVSAYIARPKAWRAWTKDWNQQKAPIKVFHATDCANYHGEFEGWDKERRDTYVSALLPVICNHGMPGLVIAVQMDDFRAAMKGRSDLLDIFGTPYGACFQWTISTLMHIANERGHGERMAFVHEVNDYKEECLKAFAWVQAHDNPHNTPISLSFGSKKDYPPLQAADILAYEGGKFLKNPTGTPRRAFTALDPDKKRLIAKRYGKDNMPVLIATLEKIASGLAAERSS
jgi:hypothetical protein